MFFKTLYFLSRMKINVYLIKKLSIFITIFACIFVFVIYSFYGLEKTKYIKRIKLRSRVKITTIKIVLWASPDNPPSGERLGRMQTIVKTMNSKSKQRNLCSKLKPGSTTEALVLKTRREEYCKFSISSGNVTGADAVVFSMFNEGLQLDELPSNRTRKLDQLWVMYGREPPPLSDWKNPLLKIFNWTMSYRRDSDVWTPYGKKLKISGKIYGDSEILIGDVTLDKWISGKSKAIAGVISRCQSNSSRETLISEMQKTEILKVDIFGECGQPVCGRHSGNCSDFWKDLGKKYRFYLAFENSLCKDYISEKFWRALDLGMVPVAYGGGNYEKEAPPNSYINVKGYKSVEELMRYLKKLEQNEEDYKKYFEWRRRFVVQGNGGQSYDWCALCKHVKILKKRKKKLKTTYKDMEWWWKHNPRSGEYICSNISHHLSFIN